MLPGSRNSSFLQRLLGSQPFWVTMALIVLSISHRTLSARVLFGQQHRQHHPELRAFRHHGRGHDLRHHHRRHRPFGRLDHGARGNRRGAVPDLGIPVVDRVLGMGLLAGLACGAVNGFFVAYVGISPFVVTLGMMSIARVTGRCRFGQPDALPVRPRCADREGHRPGKVSAASVEGDMWPDWIPAFSSHFWTMVVLALFVGYGVQLQGLGAASVRDWRQRTGRAPDRCERRCASSFRSICSRRSAPRSRRF